MEEVKVKISKKDGKMYWETGGFIGEGCAAIEELEQAMGTVTKHEDKDERYQYELQVPATQGLAC